mgnify:CR=1 FL=1
MRANDFKDSSSFSKQRFVYEDGGSGQAPISSNSFLGDFTVLQQSNVISDLSFVKKNFVRG